MFSDRSRYARSEMRRIVRPDGRVVVAVRIPIRSAPRVVGHVRPTDGERPDHLAARHLGDPTAAWRLADAARAMSPDVLMRRPTLDLPAKGA